MSDPTPVQRLEQKMDFCACELLRRYVNGTEIPPDGECGIERHFREHPEEINA